MADILKRVRVLLADDHPHGREGMRDILSADPSFEIAGEAAGGEQAVRLAEELLPDLILMDINMPGMGGMEATRLIKAANPQVKIIMVTVSDDITDLFEAVKQGAQGYLLKNLAPSAWLEYLRAVAVDAAPMSKELAFRLLQEFTGGAGSALRQSGRTAHGEAGRLARSSDGDERPGTPGNGASGTRGRSGAAGNGGSGTGGRSDAPGNGGSGTGGRSDAAGNGGSAAGGHSDVPGYDGTIAGVRSVAPGNGGSGTGGRSDAPGNGVSGAGTCSGASDHGGTAAGDRLGAPEYGGAIPGNHPGSPGLSASAAGSGSRSRGLEASGRTPLTQRELEVLERVAWGDSNRQIAESFGLSEHTVKNHLKNILQKLHLDNRVQLTRYAYEEGLLER